MTSEYVDASKFGLLVEAKLGRICTILGYIRYVSKISQRETREIEHQQRRRLPVHPVDMHLAFTGVVCHLIQSRGHYGRLLLRHTSWDRRFFSLLFMCCDFMGTKTCICASLRFPVTAEATHIRV
jgi:hypothetical protein